DDLVDNYVESISCNLLRRWRKRRDVRHARHLQSVDLSNCHSHNSLMLVEAHILDRLMANATAEKHLYYGISWDTYLQLLDELGDHRSVRVTFSRGALEVVSPKRLHEQITRP